MEDNALFFRAWGQSPRFARSEESEWPLMDKAITNLLKGTVEQRTVVGPLVQRLVSLGWDVGQLGIWANNAEETAQGVFLYRGAEGRAILKRASLKSLPRSGEAILPDSQAMKYADRSTLPISQVEIAWKN